MQATSQIYRRRRHWSGWRGVFSAVELFTRSSVRGIRQQHRSVILMGLYRDLVLPRLLDLAMRNNLLDPYRRRAIDLARGLVLEVGVGSGLNLPLYGPAVERVMALDPSSKLLDLARHRRMQALVPVSLMAGSAEQLPFLGAAFDTIIMTWTLCSIPNPATALAEMRRVLKPGGQLLFVEHGFAQEVVSS